MRSSGAGDPSTHAAVAILVAAGRGVRAGSGAPKQFRPLGGIPLLPRDFNGEGQTGRHVSLLDDRRAWGPGFAFSWQNNTWYWMRMTHEPDAPSEGGFNDVFVKIWLADGSTPEPSRG